MTEINVQIGQVKRGVKNNQLHAILGSCIGIAFLWKKKGQFGLAHCLLPTAPKTDFTINGRYVDHAITSLLTLMKIRSTDYSEIDAVVVGGGNMTQPDTENNNQLVGAMNIKSAISCLDDLGIKIVYQETGGSNGRKISVDCSTGSFDISTIPRMQTA